MHRFILSEKLNGDVNLVVDHINSDKLDNRRENLRITTVALNNQNKKVSRLNTSSKYKGVSFNKKLRKYIVSIQCDYKYKYLGTFEKEKVAARTYDMYAVHNNLDNYPLNFPKDREKYLNTKYVSKKTRADKFKYVGVFNYMKIYKTEISVNGKNVYRFSSKSAKECAIKRDEYIINNNIPLKKLNFPEKFPEYNPNTVIKTPCEEIDNETVRLMISKDNKQIVTISKDDYDKIKFRNCHICKNRGYVVIGINSKSYKLHRFLMGVTDPNIFIDHIDGNKLNNTKDNLRLSNAQKNGQNKTKKIGSSSKYLGVSYSDNKWVTAIRKNGKNIFNKSCSNKIDNSEVIIAVARDLFIINNLQDDHYPTNFSWNESDIKYWTNLLKTIF